MLKQRYSGVNTLLHPQNQLLRIGFFAHGPGVRFYMIPIEIYAIRRTAFDGRKKHANGIEYRGSKAA
jgi:hypothetical protein